MKSKFKNAKGITLVALVITIIILLILAGISISALTNTGIFGKAKESKQKSDEAALDQNTKLDEYESEINAYLPGQNNGGGGQESGINANTIASATDTEKANNYYGKSVNYTSANGVTGWKIFYADTNNIYLIADDYVKVAKLPKGTNEAGQSVGSAPANTNSSYPKAAPFDNIFDAYSTGAARITTNTIKKLNKSFFIDKQYTGVENSTVNPNMKAVAYMLDTTAWSTFKDNNEDNNGKADYAIGGPTIEMLMKSYSQKHNVQYKAEAKNDTGHEGYKISKDNGENWSSDYTDMLSTSDSLYVLPTSNGANAMWLASPSAYHAGNVMCVYCNGYVGNYSYDFSSFGFRPLVCLKSNVQLQESGDGFSIK